ncbi:MAG TPA: ATP-binding cassette domain-containing protein [Aggregatilineales bacterium]|nr:ATP-binding cassette domain-containing protein [Aggregatilineales bacterium]
MLKLDNISVIFNAGTPSEMQALRHLSLHVTNHDFVTVIGANGAGKSTLFNVITGTSEPQEGHIYLNGEEITDLPEYKRSVQIGRVFQNPGLGTCPGLTIRENLSLAAKRGGHLGLGSGVRKKQELWFRELLAEVNMGLENRLDSDVALLSGGQRQAITLVMATMMRPRLLLLDEHTAALDPNAATKITDLTLKLAEEHRLTVVMITHSMQQACSIGNRVVMMNRGQILFEISGEEHVGLTADDLIRRFRALQHEDELSDRALLDP